MIKNHSIYSKTVLLLGASVLASCGGGSSSSPSVTPPAPPAVTDTTPPTITLSASKTSVSGGETIALSVMANDNVDNQVSFNLDCNDGVLRGEFLRTPETEETIAITCTATATDAAGNSSTAEIDIDVQTTELGILEASRHLKPGEFALAELVSLQTSDTSLSIQLDGQELPVTRQGRALLFMTPLDMAPGEKSLQIDIGDKTYSFDVEVEQADIIESPEQFLTANIEDTISLIEKTIAEVGPNLTEAQISQMQSDKLELETLISDLGNQSPEDLRQVALLINSNQLFDVENNPVFEKLSLEQIAQCVRTSLRFTGSMLVTAGAIGIIAATQTNLLTSVVGLKLTYELIDFLQNNANSPVILARETWDICVEGNTKSVEIEFLEGLTGQNFKQSNIFYKDGRVSFVEGEPIRFQARANRDVAEEANDFFPTLEELISTLSEIDGIPISLISGLRELFDIPQIDVQSNKLTVTNISRDDLSVTLADESATVIYNGLENAEANIDFSFDITLEEEDVSSTIQAQLSLLPEADDIMLVLQAGETFSGIFQTRGADSIRMISNPSLGSVSLGENKSFTYTAFENSEGADQFSYEAVNERGISDPASVFIEIEPVQINYSGFYSGTVRSSTSGTPDWCINESLNYETTARISGIPDSYTLRIFNDYIVQGTSNSNGSVSFFDDETYGSFGSDGQPTQFIFDFIVTPDLHLTGTLQSKHPDCLGVDNVSLTKD